MMKSLVISGVACRFPGADDKQGYWAQICAAKNAVCPLPAGRWLADEWFDNAQDTAYFQTVPGGYVSQLEAFDYQHFGINRREASLMDPQQRWLLQIVWQALEDAGYNPKTLRGQKVGVFVGAMANDWTTLQFQDTNALLPGHVTGTGHALLSNRISYLYDFKGPSMTIATACSSSAVALVHARNAISSDECDLAIVAGVNAILTPVLQRFYQKAGLLSPSGRCNAFSDHADGIIRAEGIGAVVLEPEHLARNQYCHFIAGHINHDGQSNGLTAPNGPSQESLLRECYSKAALEPADIDFIECHGTGTSLGDRIEINALNRVFRGERKVPCGIDSVKSLIGHCEAAAAMASIIKVALMLKHRKIPANPFSDTANPLVAKGNLALSSDGETWGAEHKKHFAISSFGLGGTNAHLVFTSPKSAVVNTAPEPAFIPIAAKDEAGFQRQKNAAIRSLSQGADIKQLASGHQQLRSQGQVRDLCFGRNSKEVEESARLLGKPTYRAPFDANEAPLVFMFTGQGCQYPGMMKGLYKTFPRLRRYFDQCDAVYRQLTGSSLMPIIDNDSQASCLLTKARFAQPVLFAVEWSLAQWWMEIGFKPDAVIGHSIGEFAAASIAGVMTMEQAISLVIARGDAIDDVNGNGAMAAVLASRETLAELQQDVPGLSLAVWNSDAQFVVAGDSAAIEAARMWGVKKQVRIKPLTVTHAFHSPQMAAAKSDIEAAASKIEYHAPQLNWYSTVTGNKQVQQAIEANYWSRHLVNTVKFKPAFDTLLGDIPSGQGVIGIEMGSAPVLSMLAIKNGRSEEVV